MVVRAWRLKGERGWVLLRPQSNTASTVVDVLCGMILCETLVPQVL